HCTGCQRMSASAFSLTLAFATPAFEVTQGEPVIGGLHGASQHFFCPHCMSWIFTRPEGAAEMIVNVRASMLDDHSWFVPYLECWTSEKLAWATTPAVHSYETQPDRAVYEGLSKEYAETLKA
ncbi:MAG: aldehyde-activating protein, partial [Comamonadaceae bacterium]